MVPEVNSLIRCSNTSCALGIREKGTLSASAASALRSLFFAAAKGRAVSERPSQLLHIFSVISRLELRALPYCFALDDGLKVRMGQRASS